MKFKHSVMIVVSLALAGAGCDLVLIDGTLRMDELTPGDFEAICGAYDHGLETCAGGWRAGFVTEQACVDTLSSFAQEVPYQCSSLMVDEVRGCLELPACDRSEATECARVYACDNLIQARAEGVRLEFEDVLVE